MNTALKHLQNFIRAKDNDDERSEIRAYAIEQAETLAEAFGVSVRSFMSGVAFMGNDAKLAKRLLAEIKRMAGDERTAKRLARTSTAQASADVLGSAARWESGVAHVDVVSLVASALTSPRDLLVFEAAAFDAPVAIPMAPLFDLARLERADFSAFVDRFGLHIRWSTGGLNFLSVVDDRAERVTVNLPPHPASLNVAPMRSVADNDNAARVQVSS